MYLRDIRFATLLLLAFFAWGAVAWYWYACSIKNVCTQPQQTTFTIPVTYTREYSQQYAQPAVVYYAVPVAEIHQEAPRYNVRYEYSEVYADPSVQYMFER